MLLLKSIQRKKEKKRKRKKKKKRKVGNFEINGKLARVESGSRAGDGVQKSVRSIPDGSGTGESRKINLRHEEEEGRGGKKEKRTRLVEREG